MLFLKKGSKFLMGLVSFVDDIDIYVYDLMFMFGC